MVFEGNRFRTSLAESLMVEFHGPLVQFLREVDGCLGLSESKTLDALSRKLEGVAAQYPEESDALFNDLFVLDCYLRFLGDYGRLWRLISVGEFSESWMELQNAINKLELVRRHSGLEVSNLGEQLAELERAYPYRVFLSVGMMVDRIECSLCGDDIDSPSCTHRRGELYRGRLASGIIRDVSTLDHVALVENPRDRRCVVIIENDGPQFNVVRAIANLLVAGSIKVSEFKALVFTKRRVQNELSRRGGRNGRCFCGSGRKFKHCCLSKELVEREHVDIVGGLAAHEQLIE